MLLNCGVGEDSFFFFLIFKLYIIVLFLPNIKMNPPQVYMGSPSWTLLPPPSPFHPSGSSQCTSPKHPVLCIEPESPLYCKEIQPVHPKGNHSWVFIGRTDVEAEIPILWPPDELTHWKRPWCYEILRAGGEGDDRGWDGWMASSINGHGFAWTPGVGDGQGGLACCSLCSRKELDTTEWLNWTELIALIFIKLLLRGSLMHVDVPSPHHIPKCLLRAFSSVAHSCLTFYDPMNRSKPGLPVHHQLWEFTQTHVHWVCDAIQPSHPL